MVKLTFFNLGNADCCRIELAGGERILFDYGNQRNGDDCDDLRSDLPEELRKDLKQVKRDYFDVVAFTHLDRDHYERATDFFFFDHIKEYQKGERVKMREMWVPAAVITEPLSKDQDTVEAKAIQKEARERFKAGKGIRVFSRPDRLKKWLDDNGLTVEQRKHLITDAGQLIPGWTKEKHGAEFFVHSPFAKRQNEKEVCDRNADSLIVHATFSVEAQETRLFLGSDAPHDVLADIVTVTESHGKQARLKWDIFKLPHHCSYKSLSEEKGEEKTVPDEEVGRLFEDYREDGGIVVSPSCPIPAKGSEEDNDDQPPHRQAANYYKEDVVSDPGNEFKVTMEHPTTKAPVPLVIRIDSSKATVEKAFSGGVASIVTRPAPRAG